MVNTPGKSINEKNRQDIRRFICFPLFCGHIYRLWIKPPWFQFIKTRLV